MFLAHTAYKVVLALVVNVPPALYDALVALLEVLQPWKVYPVRVGVVEESLRFVVCHFVCELGAPLPPFAL